MSDETRAPSGPAEIGVLASAGYFIIQPMVIEGMKWMPSSVDPAAFDNVLGLGCAIAGVWGGQLLSNALGYPLASLIPFLPGVPSNKVTNLLSANTTNLIGKDSNENEVS